MSKDSQDFRIEHDVKYGATANNNEDDLEEEEAEIDIVNGDRYLLVYRVIAVVSTCIAVMLLAAVIVLGIFYQRAPVCDKGLPIIPNNLEKPEIFDELTVAELETVRDYLISRKDLNLVSFDNAAINSSYIYMIDLLLPLKAAVLKNLDRGSRQPVRTAKVVIFRGDLRPPRVEEYHVGPIPRPTYARLITNPSYTTSRVPFNARPVSEIEYKVLYEHLEQASEDLYFLLRDSYDLAYHNCTSGVDCIIFKDTAPRGLESGDRKTWFWAFRDIEGSALHPLGLEIQINHESMDTTQWHISRILYNGYLFYSVEELMTKYMDNRITKITVDPVGFTEHLYSSYVKRGKTNAVPSQGPKLVEPNGRRHMVVGNHVKYIDWDFHVHIRSSTGLQIFDVRFQEERIAYEISLQDAVVMYSGFGPSQSSTVHYDTSMLMGRLAFEMVPGVDCPDTAVFLDTHHFVDTTTPRKFKNAICIFENNGGIPLRRHYESGKQGGFKSYGGLVDYHLVVRTIVSIWSYDFIFDYIFHLNGAIEVKVSQTGYIQSTYALPYESAFGYKIHDFVIGTLHQHLFHFKVDLDINGSRNRYATLDTSVVTKPSQWYRGINHTYIGFEKVDRKREQDVIFDTGDASKHRFDIIYNNRATSKFGSNRAYRIFNLAMSDLFLEDSKVANAARWAKYPLAVTQFKDTEEMSTSIYAQNDPWKPVVDFDRFLFNNESIVDEDLVAWVTMGRVHIPHTEDVPSNSITGNQYTFFLLPFNYFTECPSIGSPNAVRIRPALPPNGNKVETFGTSFESTCVQESVGPFEYDGSWDHVVSDGD